MHNIYILKIVILKVEIEWTGASICQNCLAPQSTSILIRKKNYKNKDVNLLLTLMLVLL